MTAINIIRRPRLEEKTGLSRSAVYDRMNQRSPRYDPTFPTPINLGGAAVGWIEADVDAWILACAEAPRRDHPASKARRKKTTAQAA